METMNPDSLRNHLAESDMRSLIALLAYRTGDDRWTAPKFVDICANLRDNPGYLLDPESRDEIVDGAMEMLSGTLPLDREGTRICSDADLLNILQVVAGAEFGEAYVPRLKEELGITSPKYVAPSHPRRHIRVVVIGAGLAGLYLAKHLVDTGIEFLVVERNEEVGGVWLQNNYPDCGCDAPDHLYGFQDELNIEWSRYYARRGEILNYIKGYAAKHQLYRYLRLSTTVVRAWYEDATHQWAVEVEGVESAREIIHCDVLITAVGSLNQPKFPSIPGWEQFKGVSFHTAEWRHDVSLYGKRVGLIGNGSSGVQVARNIAAVAQRLTIFQRSPGWVRLNPKTNLPTSEGLNWCLKHVPGYKEWFRFILYCDQGDAVFKYLVKDPEWGGDGISLENERLRKQMVDYIVSQIGDKPDLVRKLVPTYPPYTKRMVVDNDWYATCARSNVEVVTEPIVSAGETGLQTEDGEVHDLDVVVFATGFHNTRYLYPMDIRGRGGRSVADVFGSEDEAEAYMGMAVPGFPNFFSIDGPNSGFAAGSATLMIHCQARYIMQCLTKMIDEDIRAMECKQDVCAKYNRWLDEVCETMVWSRPEAGERLLNRKGRVVGRLPMKLQDFWLMSREPDWAAYHLE